MSDPRESFEIVYDPAEGTAFVYRSLWAGVCGPFTEPVPVAGTLDAEGEALRYGLMRTGEWRRTGNGSDVAPAERVTL